MAEVRAGIYLEEHPPKRAQSRARRDDVRSVISIHTAESGTDFAGIDLKAENVARFIRDRTTAGSYHLVGDSDSIVQLLDMNLEAFQARGGSNRWAIGISLAMNAADWAKLSTARRGQFVDTAAQMSVIAARWLQARGLPAPAAVRLTKAQAFRGDASGFIDHARLDPARRSDPGVGFPWQQFFRSYQAQLTQSGGETVTELTDIEDVTMDLQRLLLSWGVGLGQTGSHGDWVDGDPGVATVAGSAGLIRYLIHELSQSRKVEEDWGVKLARVVELADELRDIGVF